MTTPDEPTSGARVRARARVGGPRLRAGVAEAVTGVERSLVDLATWERLQALEDATPRFAGAQEARAAAPGAEVAEPVEAPVADLGAADDDDTQIPLMAGELPPPPPAAIDEPATAALPLLTQFTDEGAPADDLPESVLAGARSVPPVDPTQADAELEEVERRRRKGKIYSWTGVALLLVVAAIWLIPDRNHDDGNDKVPADRTTSTTDGALLLPDEETTTSVADTTTTEVTAPVSAATTPTTAKKKSTGGSTATTQPPPATTTTTTATTQPPIQQPGPGPSRTVPTTTPSTTTTTAAPGSVP